VSTSQERLDALTRQAARLERRIAAFSARSYSDKMTQLAIFVGGILLVSAALAIARWLGLVLLAAGIVAFILVGRRQRRVDRSLLRQKFWLQMLQKQIARMRLDWQALPPPLPLEKPEDHPFDSDLDISGPRSLHQLLSTAVTFQGAQQLLDWLLCREPDPDAISRRRALVRELIPMTRFRNKLMLHSLLATRFTNEALDGERLVAWLEDDEQTAPAVSPITFPVAVLLWLLAVVALIMVVFAHLPPLFFIVAWALSIIWFLLRRKEEGDLANDASFLRLAFLQLNEVLSYLEAYPYPKHSQLRTLCEPFFIHGDRRPSLLLKRLERITRRANLASGREGWLVANALLPIGPYVVSRLNRYKAQIAEYLPIWLDAWYELEALTSLANFAYLNPDYVMPEIVAGKKREGEQPMVLRASALGHPLIDRERKVVNDFALGAPNEVIMITGSNMAGKSTFLRTLGINLCLAFAGTVVNATAMQTSLFELYACIKVTDSLADGYSYFYAEVRRLKGLLVELEQGTRFPMFFLIDEIFKGTNNYERLIGSEAYIRALVGKYCVGAISTHDLELVKLADAFPLIKNYHFKEDVVDGQMVFDYLLHPGPSPTRNALRIMQMEGLPVRWEAAAPPPAITS